MSPGELGGMVGGAATAPRAVAAPPARELPHWAKLLLGALAGATVAGLGALVGLARFGGAYERQPFEPRVAAGPAALTESEAESRAERVEKKIRSQVSDREVYVTVDSHENRLRVYRGGELLREAVCSTGSGVRLLDPRNGREWVFDTPQGELRILRKVRNPVWVKPDWAFIEEGYEPPRNMRDRVDDFSLGDFGLYMRDGYIIHGTIFKSLLGKRVTHGCIRLGDEDLEFAYKTIPVGARVFLY
ncbi:MAG TPA: L,D-transpeptidase family protein [Thermoanaerobaculia bacterium]|nr:L,D-transpeptidase family protein [Thermoanaerobaculia bacterium]